MVVSCPPVITMSNASPRKKAMRVPKVDHWIPRKLKVSGKPQ